MGWKKDWLYGLIFSDIRIVWLRASLDAATFNQSVAVIPYPNRSQQGLDHLLIEQCGNGDLTNARCLVPVLRSWVFRGAEFEEQATHPGVDKEDLKGIPSPFFRQGTVRFFITDDRKRVILTYVLGPLYGRGFICIVTGQGRTGKLSPSRDSLRWFA